MNEQQLVEYLKQRLIDDPNVQKYMNEHYDLGDYAAHEYLVEAQLELHETKQELIYAQRTNMLHRLLGQVATELYCSEEARTEQCQL